MQFNKGDVVQLKSGGPKMTVADITDEGGRRNIHCRFFDKSNNMQFADFDETELAPFKSQVGVVMLRR